ncbi:MAG: hypothetical protein M1326_08665, partial [Cyanobacteria bacterium]|nr:hypothetical protein [Cyanobacteriota bacterium]
GNSILKKWWEKKVEAYSNIIKDLKDFHYCVSELYDRETGLKQLDDNRLDKLGRTKRKSYETLKLTALEKNFVISKEAAMELDRFIKETAYDYPEQDKEPLSEYYGRLYENVEECLKNFRFFAKKDLKVS